MKHHILVVLPHPDDETFGLGGTIAQYTKKGTPVTYACGTLGEMGRNMGNPFFATRETLPIVREKELREACTILGIKDVRLLGLRDKTIEFEDPDIVANQIEALIRELKPSIIMTHYPGHGVHPDHDALGVATVLAVSRFPQEERPVLHTHAITKNRIEALGEPDIVVDITPVVETKLAALRAHRSQTENMFKKWDADPDAKSQLMARWSKEVFWTYRFD